MARANEEIRRAARAAGVPLWRIAMELGVSEPTMTRWLRVPLSPEKSREILAIIAKLEKGE